MRWEFAEAVLTSESSGGLITTVGNLVYSLTVMGSDWESGSVEIADARKHPLPSQSCDVWFTDPPYYDAIPYSDLSDFFFVWLKRLLHKV